MSNKLMLTQGEQNNFLSNDFGLQNLKLAEQAQSGFFKLCDGGEILNTKKE